MKFIIFLFPLICFANYIPESQRENPVNIYSRKLACQNTSGETCLKWSVDFIAGATKLQVTDGVKTILKDDVKHDEETQRRQARIDAKAARRASNEEFINGLNVGSMTQPQKDRALRILILYLKDVYDL